jgi:hypothetical protein
LVSLNYNKEKLLAIIINGGFFDMKQPKIQIDIVKLLLYIIIVIFIGFYIGNARGKLAAERDYYNQINYTNPE